MVARELENAQQPLPRGSHHFAHATFDDLLLEVPQSKRYSIQHERTTPPAPK